MADPWILTDGVVCVGADRLSPQANQVSIMPKTSEHDVSAWEDVAHTWITGAEDPEISFTGYSSASSDFAILQKLEAGTAEEICFYKSGASPGARGLFFLGQPLGQIPIGGQYDTPATSGASFKSAGDRVNQGYLLYSAVGTAGITATAAQAGVNAGAVSATQEVVCVVRMVNPPGVSGTSPTLGVILESDTSDAWAAPTTRHTFTNFTGNTVQRATVSGAITDTWWRINFNSISGAGATFYPVVFLAIRSIS